MSKTVPGGWMVVGSSGGQGQGSKVKGQFEVKVQVELRVHPELVDL